MAAISGTAFKVDRTTSIRAKVTTNVPNWPLCAGPGSAGLQLIAAPLPDVPDQWVLIVQRQLIREQRKHIRLTYCMHASQVLAGQL